MRPVFVVVLVAIAGIGGFLIGRPSSAKVDTSHIAAPTNLVGVWVGVGIDSRPQKRTQSALLLFSDWTYLAFHRPGRKNSEVIGKWFVEGVNVVLEPRYSASQKPWSAEPVYVGIRNRVLISPDGIEYRLMSHIEEDLGVTELAKPSSMHAMKWVLGNY